MPLPLGTNARQLYHITRAAFAAATILLPLTFWWPDIGNWSSWLAVMVGLGLLWLWWRTTGRLYELPGHLLIAGFFTGVFIVGYHLARLNLRADPAANPVGEELMVTLAVQWTGLSLLVVLSLDLLTDWSDKTWFWTLLGLATFTGSAIALASHPAAGKTMLSMLGWTGVALFIWPALPRAQAVIKRMGFWQMIATAALTFSPAGRRIGIALWALRRFGRLTAAGIMAVILAFLSGRGLLVAAVCTIAVCAVWLLRFSNWYVRAGILAVAVAGAGLFRQLHIWPARPNLPATAWGWLGHGREALERIPATTPGVGWLVEMIGPLGVGAIMLAMIASFFRAWWSFRPQVRADHARPLGWTVIAALSAAAFFLPMGAFTPAAGWLLAVTWAMLPLQLGRVAARHSGWWTVFAALVVSLIMGLAARGGLPVWAAIVFGRTDTTLHLISGLLLTQVLLWLLGGRALGAVAAVAISLLLAIGGEFAQHYLSLRSGQMEDVLSHAAGAAVALLAYVLCRLSRATETPDAAATTARRWVRSRAS